MKHIIYLSIALFGFVGFTLPNWMVDPEPMPSNFHQIDYESPIEIKNLNAAIEYGKLSFHLKNACSSCHNAKDIGGHSDISFPVGGTQPMFDKLIAFHESETVIDLQTVGTPSIMNLGKIALTDGALGLSGINSKIDSSKLCQFNKANRVFANKPETPGFYKQIDAALGAHFLKDMVAAARSKETFNILAHHAFGDIQVTEENMAAAIGIFEKSFITWNAPYQKHLRGEIEFKDLKSPKGITLIKEKCVSCHSGVFFGNEKRSMKYGNSDFVGLFRVTKDSADIGQVVAPTLYNQKWNSGYFHDESERGIIGAIREHTDVKTTTKERRLIAKAMRFDLHDPDVSNRVFQLRYSIK